MTPTEHATAAAVYIERLSASSSLTPSDADQLVGEAHAILAGAAGSGTHYTDAEDAIAKASSAQSMVTRLRAGRLAVMHAHLADR